MGHPRLLRFPVTVTNPFSSEPVVHRYVRGRPYYHRFALDLAVRRLGIDRVGVAVDLGCGTGLSTRALSEVADRIIACDLSPAMLRAADRGPRTHYLVAGAEQLPIRAGIADLVTIAAALHWFDQPRVFPELARILTPGGTLIVYSDYFLGQIPSAPAFADWFTDTYLPTYPSPARNHAFDCRAAQSSGFGDLTYRENSLPIPLTHGELADYLSSQSNAAVAIESGLTSAADLRATILTATATFFPTPNPIDITFTIRTWTATSPMLARAR